MNLRLLTMLIASINLTMGCTNNISQNDSSNTEIMNKNTQSQKKLTGSLFDLIAQATYPGPAQSSILRSTLLNKMLSSHLNDDGQLNDIAHIDLTNNTDLAQTLLQTNAVSKTNLKLNVSVVSLLILYKIWKDKKKKSSIAHQAPTVPDSNPEIVASPEPITVTTPTHSNPFQGVYECYLGKPTELDYSVFPSNFEFDHNIHLGGIVEFKVDSDLQIRKGYTVLHGNRFDVVGTMNTDGNIELKFSYPTATYFFGNFKYSTGNNLLTGRVYEPGNEYIQGQCFSGGKNSKIDL